jgi:hypothetical protein
MPAVWEALLATARRAEWTIERQWSDDVGGEMIARRSNGEAIRITAQSLDAARTEITLQGVEPVLAQVIQDHIADVFYRGYTAEEVYPTDLGTCVTAARRAFAVLHLSVASETIGPTEAEFEAGVWEGVPFHLRMIREGPFTTRVWFLAGHSKTPATERSLIQLKTTFRRSLYSGPRND